MAKKIKVLTENHKKKLVEQKVTDHLRDEFRVGSRNEEQENSEFESVIDLLECQRNERDYEWMSDVFIPEYPSIFLTEASQWANQYFQSRDFVEVYLSGETPQDKLKAQMAKKYLNTSLNIKELYHYQKYMRLRSINSLRGACYALARWERKVEREELEVPQMQVMEDPLTGMISEGEVLVPQTRERIVVDRFNYDPIDPRNVVMDNKYAYSLQEKEWIILRDEVSYETLKAEEGEKGYFNLAKVKEIVPAYKTETEKAVDSAQKNDQKPQRPIGKKLDRLLRFGKFWSVVTEKDELGFPIASRPGLDERGVPLEEAKLVESIIEEVHSGEDSVLIRFQPTPYRTSKGVPYRPLIRGLCYVHPTRDVGMSDGKYSRELQVALNDTINMSNDRTKLATLPTFKAQQNAVVGNDQIFFAPEHIIPLPNVADLEEMVIRDNVKGALEQASLFIMKLQQVNSIYPTTMGQLPAQASTTATAVAGTDMRANMRANYKSLTFEFTYFMEFYWMMLQMAYQFMHPQTALTLWGDSAEMFDPDADYSYSPVTSNVEMEYTKDRKVTRYDQILGRIAQIPNPAIIPIIAYIIQQQCVLLGAEFQDIAPMVEVLKKTPNTPEGTMPETPPQEGLPPTSNQTGNLMSLPEQQVRGM